MKNMLKPEWQTYAIWLLKANLVIWAINGMLLPVLVLFGYNISSLISSDYFSKITFFETGVALLIGGALAFLGSASASKNKELITKTQEEWSIDQLKKSEKKANKYLIFAVIMFAQSILLSLWGI
jgi:hypothetical protein